MLINVTVLFENLADQFVFSCHSVNGHHFNLLKQYTTTTTTSFSLFESVNAINLTLTNNTQ